MSLPSARCTAYSYPYPQQDVLHIRILNLSKMCCIFLSLRSARCPAYSCPYHQQDVLHTHVLTVSKISCIFKVNTFLFPCLFVRLAFCRCLFLCFFLSLKQNVRLYVWWSLRCPRQRTCSLRNPYPQQDVLHIQSEHLFVCLLLWSFGDVVAVCFFPSFFSFFLSFFLCSFFLFFSFSFLFPLPFLFKAKCQTVCVMVSTLPPATHVQRCDN